MTFDYPFMLSALLVLIPLVLFDILRYSRNSKYRLPRQLVERQKISAMFFNIFIACVIIAFCSPRWGIQFTVSEYRRGLDAVFAIDVSRSMDIRDAYREQSRLERGLSIARESASAAAGPRYAAAVGRGRGLLAVPLTWEGSSVLSFLEALDGSLLTGRSTNLESLIDAAANAFQSSSPARKIIILVSDGEAISGVIRNALDRCAKEDIIVTAIALGSDEGRLLPSAADALKDQDKSSDGDAYGDASEERDEIISRREAAVMRMAAERTGGIYIDGSEDNAAAVLTSHILSLVKETTAGGGHPEPKERRSLFIILAVIFFAVSKLVPRLPAGKSLSRLTHASILTAVLILSSGMQSCSQGKLSLLEANYLASRGRHDEAIIPYLKAMNYTDAAPYAEYGLGLSFYMLDEGSAALQHYENSQKMLDAFLADEHSELRYRNSYNTGIILFGEGDYSAASQAFKDALRENPRKIEAKRNLELSLMSIAKENAERDYGEKKQENIVKDILFDHLRQKEQQKWKSGEWAPEEKNDGLDM